MRKNKERIEEGLHSIENEKRPRAIHKKKGGVKLKAKYHRRVTKALAACSIAAVLFLGVFGVNALFFQKAAPNIVEDGFMTVAYELPTDGSTPADYASADLSDALKNIGFMNTRFKGQKNWYSEMHGTVDTILSQSVNTYKQFDDGILIMADITTSSMVNVARQFCYVGDRVLWREAAGGASSYNGIDTPWETRDPRGNMMIADFKREKGLPGTEFSVYVINEETLTKADPVVKNADGTFSQTYYLDPATDKAPAYYVNQMLFTGGLTALPSFSEITVTYTFDSTWQVLQSEIGEKYTATMGISVGCSASYRTVYEYNTPKAESDAYETYYKDYASKPATGSEEESLSAVSCLSSAFGPVLQGPVNFKLGLKVDGEPAEGVVYVNAKDMMESESLDDLELRAKLSGLKIKGVALQDIFVELSGGEVYLNYGGNVKVKLSLGKVSALLGALMPSDGASLDTDALMAQLSGGEFKVAEDKRSATLDSELDLLGFKLPVHFDFNVAEDGKTVSLGGISADISLGEDIPLLGGTQLGASLAYTNDAVPALSDAEKKTYSDLDGLLGTVQKVMEEKSLAFKGDLAVQYQNTKVKISVENGAVSWKEDFRLSLDLVIAVGDTRQKVSVYADGGRVKLVYGDVGVDLVYQNAQGENELTVIGDAFKDVYARITDILNKSLTGIQIPALEELADEMQGGGAIADLLSFILPNLLTSALQDLTFTVPENGGFAAVELYGLTAELAANGGLQLILGGEPLEGLKLDGSSLSVGTLKGEIEEPQGEYLQADDLAQLLDFAGAAVATLASDDVRFTFQDSWTYTADPAAEEEAKKFEITGELAYHAGEKENGKPLLSLDTTDGNKSLVVNPNAYVYFKLWLDDTDPAADDLFFEFWMFDRGAQGQAEGDGEHDLFVSVSKNKPYLTADGTPTIENTGSANPAYIPLNFTLSAGDLLTAAAGGVSVVEEMLGGMLGKLQLDGIAEKLFAVLDEYFVSKWLTADEEAQLGAIGGMLAETLGLNKALEGALGSVTGALSGEGKSSALAEADTGAYLTALGVTTDENGETVFTIALDSDAVYGGEGLKDLTLTFRKAGEKGSSYLTGISLQNIYGNSNSERTDVNFALSRMPLALARTADGVTLSQETGEGQTAGIASLAYGAYQKYNFTGLGELVRSVARSATHKTESGEYKLNESFYLTGEFTLNVFIGDVTIRIEGLSVSFDEEGGLILSAKISYDQITGVIPQGGTVELTLRDNILYLCRTLNGGSAEYRVMPLSNFAAGIMDHLVFMLNLSGTVQDIIRNAMPSGDSSGGATVTSDDYGTLLAGILTSYSFNGGEEASSWQLTLNGNALTNGTLGDINVTLGAEKLRGLNNVLRTLTLGTKLAGILSVSGTLTYRNPCNVVDSDYVDAADGMRDLSAVFTFGSRDWSSLGETGYLAGTLAKVSFSAGGQTVSEQNVLVGADGTAYSEVILPDLAPFAQKGQDAAWSKTDFSHITGNETVYLKYTPKKYVLTLVSDREAEGFYYDASRGKWIKEIVYTYGQLDLPFAADEQMRIVGYTDANGNVYDASSDGKEILSDTELTAQWEEVDYTIEYIADGVCVGQQSAHYGDAFTPPAAPEKTGYHFVGWELEEGAAVTGNVAVNALYAPNTYTYTLLSERGIEGFTFDEASKMYKKEIAYTYDTQVALTAGLSQDGYYLNGFVYEGKLYTQAPNVAADITLTAQWAEQQYAVRFEADGEVVATRYFREGDVLDLSDLPAVPAKTGYTGVWDVSDGTAVTGDMTVPAVYTANTYTVLLVSGLPLEGYAEQDGVWVKEVSYVYDGTPVALDGGVKVACYDFGGYFTQEGGLGEEVTAIDNQTAFAEKIYLYWIDNTVTVTLLSDIALEGFAFDNMQNGYTKTVSFNDVYTFGYQPSAKGYQFLGWFAQANGGWEMISDVRGLDGGTLVAVWISEMQVAFTDVSMPSIGLGYEYTVKGNVRGGTVYGYHSEEVAKAIGLAGVTSGFYRIYGADGGTDDLKYGETFALEYDKEGVAQFGAEKMTSTKYGTHFTDQAKYGGVVIERKFTYGGKEIVVRIESAVSIATYTVTFLSDDGTELKKSEGLRLPCPYAAQSPAVSLKDIAPSLAARTGYDAGWDISLASPVTGNMTVRAVYTPKQFNVTFVSPVSLGDGWTENADGTYSYTALMNYGAVISFRETDTVFGSYTVGLGDQVVTLPAVESGLLWKSFEISAEGASFTAGADPFIVTYTSTVAFTCGGTQYGGDYTVEYYHSASAIAPTAEGYVFLGWFYQEGGVWKQFTSVAYDAENPASLTVSALWRTDDLQVAATNFKKSGVFTKTYTGTATVTGGQLVGACADAVQAAATFEFFANNDGNQSGKGYTNGVSDPIGYDGTSLSQSCDFKTDNKSCLNVEAVVTYTFNGNALGSATLFASQGV